MSYSSLRDLLYRDQSPDRFRIAQETALARLEAESTFRTGIEMGSEELFLAVPRELSLLNEKVLCYERRIAAHLRAVPPVAQWALIRGLVVDEVVSTNSLEGVYSTRRQIDELLQRNDEGNPLGQKRFRELARLYLDLYGKVPDRPSTPEDIRAIYDRVMDGEPLDNAHKPDGKLFRRDGVEIFSPNGKRVHIGVEPEDKISEMLAKMLDIVNSEDIPKTYSAIIGHFVFEYVHPFYDGNGRTGRYLLALHLSSPLSILTSLSLSRVLAENRSGYYRAFREVEHAMNHGELTPFVISMLENVRAAQTDLDVELGRKQDLYEHAVGKLRSYQDRHDLSDKNIELVFYLAQLKLFAAFPEATLAEIADYIGLSKQQTRTHTLYLEERNVIQTVSARPLRFVLEQNTILELGLD